MSAKAMPSDLPFHSFPSSKDFEDFLDREHGTLLGFYLKLAKKDSGIPSISAAESVEVALCFGWIDGWGRGIDASWYIKRFTPRRAKSIWSQKNVETVGRLSSEGRMRPAGIVEVEAAKADGRWDRAYHGSATITVPDDLTLALAAQPSAAGYFETLSRTERYSVLWRIETTSPRNRASKIETLVETLAEGKLSRSLTSQQTKPQKKAQSTANPRKRAVSKLLSAQEQPEEVPAANVHETRQSRRAGLRKRL